MPILAEGTPAHVPIPGDRTLYAGSSLICRVENWALTLAALGFPVEFTRQDCIDKNPGNASGRPGAGALGAFLLGVKEEIREQRGQEEREWPAATPISCRSGNSAKLSGKSRESGRRCHRLYRDPWLLN